MGKRARRLEKKKKFAVKRNFKTITGFLSTAPGGFGFVNEKDGESEIFVPPYALNHAIHGDLVEVRITSPNDPRGPSGEIAAILSREREFMVCEFMGNRSARPVDKNISAEIRISGSLKGAHKGDWLRLRLLDSGAKYTESLRGTVEEILGKANSIAGDLNAVAAEFGMPDPYSPQLEKEALKLVPSGKTVRRDLTGLFIVTIDPADAKDFDDALSIESVSAREWRIGVHIADVAAYVRPGTKFDKEARKRSFSSYIPGMFRPMLPKPLTAKISLSEGKKACAHTVFLRVRKRDGAILGSERCFSDIVVKKRLNFDEVQNFHEGKTPDSWDSTVRSCITDLLKATEKMRACRKKKEEFLEIEAIESRVLVDEERKNITGFVSKSERRSDQLVEDCMLAANSAVAEEMIERKAAGLFRIHPEPDPERLEEFMQFAFDVLKRAPGDLFERSICNDFLQSLPDDHRKYVLSTAFLRAMSRASYSAEPGLHYGLGKSRYSHFTSPIRRYPDLLIHQQLHALDENSRLHSRKAFAELAAEVSGKEENNDNAYFAALDRLKLHYLKSINALESHDLYEGVLIKISEKNGWTCDIPSIGLRGFVPKRFLPRTNRNPQKPGNLVYLVLDSLDFPKATAIFRPVL